MALDKDLKKRWVDALRSGDYAQAKEALRGPVRYEDGIPVRRKGEEYAVGYCCLGVLCDIEGAEFDTSRIVNAETGEVVAKDWAEFAAKYGEDPDFDADEYDGVFLVDRVLTDEQFDNPTLKRLGISSDVQKTLIRKNDAGVPFDKIADHIERYL